MSSLSPEAASSPALFSHLALGLSTLVLGYWLGVGRSLFAYRSEQSAKSAKAKQKARRTNEDESAESDEDESESVSEGESDEGEMSPSLLKAGLLEECKLVLLVRTDLKMDKGKIAAQCCHATLACYKSMQGSNPQLLKHWERIGQAKVALKCPTEEEMNRLEKHAKSLGLCARSIRDAGRTQIAAGSKTVLGIGPGPVKIVDQVTGESVRFSLRSESRDLRRAASFYHSQAT